MVNFPLEPNLVVYQTQEYHENLYHINNETFIVGTRLLRNNDAEQFIYIDTKCCYVIKFDFSLF